MKPTILVKSILSWAFLVTGITSAFIRKRAGNKQYMIMMYHRVLAANPMMQPGMYVAPETFERHLVFLKKHFSIIPLTELVDSSSLKNMLEKNVKPVCVLTFDDGWIDFYQNVFPLLKKYQVPATVFLPTNFIGLKKKFWTDRLASILKWMTTNTYSVDQSSPTEILDLVDKFSMLDGSLQDRLDVAAEMLKKYSQQEINRILDQIEVQTHSDDLPGSRDFIDWGEVKIMYQSGLVDFGSHTVNHEILTNISDEAITNELIESKKALLDHQCVDENKLTFCYPNGNFSSDIAKLVAQNGYKLAVTTRSDWNSCNKDMLELNRVAVHQDISSTTAMFAARISGIF